MLDVGGIRTTEAINLSHRRKDAPADHACLLWLRGRQCIEEKELVPGLSLEGPILFLLYTADLLTIIDKHGLQGHLYADDSQVYGFCRPNSTDVQHLRSVSTSCISDIADWMK